MLEKEKGKRGIKKEIQRQFEGVYDLRKLDYKTRVKPVRPKAILWGTGVAFTLYGIGFFLSYIGWNNNTLAYEGFAKLVWIMMIPSTVIGTFVFALAKNRMEYPLRQDILKYVAQLEAKSGMLWRFEPLFQKTSVTNVDVKKAFAHSREGQIDKIAVEDYTDAVQAMYSYLLVAENTEFTATIAEEIEGNFRKGR